MDNFHNASNSSIEVNAAMDSAAEQAFKVIVYILIIMMSLIGNGLVITVIFKDKRNTNTNRFIVNMCASDILTTLWVFPEHITSILSNQQWLIDGEMGDFLCKMVSITQDVSAGVSIYSMTIIAFDRFFAIVLPFRTHFITTRRCYIMISCTWVLSIMLHIPYLLFNRVIHVDASVLACRQIWPDHLNAEHMAKKFFLTQFSLVFAFPLILITVFYFAVLVELNRKTNDANQNAEQQRIRQRENLKVSLMLITVVVLFVVSWAPMLTLGFIYFFGDIEKIKIPAPTFRFIANFMVHSNAAQNAVIYFTFNNRFKKGAKKILLRRRFDDGPYESQTNGSSAPVKRWHVNFFNVKRDEETREERLELTVQKANCV